MNPSPEMLVHLRRTHTTANSNEQKIVIYSAHKRMKDVATACVFIAVNATDFS